MENYILQNLEEDASLICKDFTLSQQEFELHYHQGLDMMVTYPRPQASELSQFYESEDYISHTDSRRSLFEKLYQLVKNYMIDTKLNWIQNEVPGKGDLLDIGAGTGDFLVRAKSNGWKVSGAEPSSKARSLTAKKGLSLEQDTSQFETSSFDVITMWHVLEHVSDLEAQIQELDRLLKKDGTLIVAVPNFKSYDAKHYKEFWAAYDVPRHLWHFSETAISEIFSAQDFVLTSKKPLVFDAFYVSLLSEKYKTGKMNYLRGFYNGLLSNLKAGKTKEFSSAAYFLRKL